MQYVLVVTVGPVQGFIAAARRSRDLWYGSNLLSELAKAAALSLYNADAKLIFPAPEQPSDLNPDTALQAANRIVAIIEGDVRTIAEQAQAQVQQRMQELWSAAQKNLHGPIDQEVADQQIRDLPEVTWVATPLNGTYAQARQRVEHLMAARKATIAFVPVPWSANGQTKSSLDGQREAVIPENQYPKRTASTDQKAQTLYNKYGAGPGERLSGVDLLKRLGSKGHHVPSTSHMAALPLVARIAQGDIGRATEAWNMYLELVKRCGGELETYPKQADDRPYDRQVVGPYAGLLFAERLSDYLDPVPAQIQHCLSSFLALYAGKQQPLPYYAMLHADGDRMGETISQLAKAGANQHRELSRALATFATNAQTIIERDHQGVLIYAGGDDVLALLPLHTALKCTQQLADKFKTHMQAFGSTAVPAPTLSAGLAIVHHVEPLSDALDLARAAEKRAKKVPGKNALAITLSKRSGSDRTISGTWGEIDQRMKTFIRMHRNDDLPDGAAYQLQELAQMLPLPDDGMDRSLIEAARQAEALRLLKRKRARRGTEDLDQEVRTELEGYLKSMRLGDLVDELIVARMFASAEDLALMEVQP
ncbi:MAG: type III-B CRISPR-associated protein Cas10/Cmr2 [Roseiflexaceae bacterium]|nr:type III-B CRISPR-associated protein Cas10/Cmr2 [Roseiflexaceae bacterium]